MLRGWIRRSRSKPKWTTGKPSITRRSGSTAPCAFGMFASSTIHRPASLCRRRASFATRATWRRAAWPSGSSGQSMPLSRLQKELLKHLAAGRNPESVVGGAAPLNRIGPRTSDDIDIFHRRAEAVAATAQADIARLNDAGYPSRWVRQSPAIWSAVIDGQEETTKLEWVLDSDYRFFPPI